MNFALVPVKALAWGKSRLSVLLSEDARRAVSRAMLTDVLTSLRHSSSIEKFAVVSSDTTLLSLAQEFGAYAVHEGQPRGLNGAVALGTDFCLQHGATALLVLLADLPLVEPEDVNFLFQQAEEVNPGVVLATCKEWEGTNALLRVPPLVIPPCFGGPSLARHRAAAQRGGVPFRAIEVPHLAFDIDSVEDLRQLLTHPSKTQTYHVLQEIDVLKKSLEE
ncbi:MAG: 2-phospho-L-lactate guanylyltransferase [Candidatus Binatia bacterium]